MLNIASLQAEVAANLKRTPWELDERLYQKRNLHEKLFILKSNKYRCPYYYQFDFGDTTVATLMKWVKSEIDAYKEKDPMDPHNHFWTFCYNPWCPEYSSAVLPLEIVLKICDMEGIRSVQESLFSGELDDLVELERT